MTNSEILQYLGNLPDNDIYLPMLARQVNTGGIVPFIGAGMSAPFGFPQWSAFLRELAGRAQLTAAIESRISAGQYEEAAEDLVAALTPQGFQALVKHHFGDHVLKGRSLNGAIAAIPEISRGPVFTTNFDHLLENAFRNAGCAFESEIWVSAAELAVEALQDNSPVLLKLHGDWRDAQHRVLTLSQYRNAYGDPDGDIDLQLPLPRLLYYLSVRPVLFLGCSLNQDRTVSILKRVAEKGSSLHFAVVQMPAASAAYQERRRYLLSRDIRPIWYPEGEHAKVEGLLRYLAEQVPAELRRTCVAKAVDTIPTRLTTFIGREGERKDVLARLRRNRLVTIAGPPGSGKTRLAIELARSVRGDYGALWFVDFSQHGAKDVEQHKTLDFVLQRVGTVLRLPNPGQTSVESLVNHLQDGRNLLVLDNCEWFVGAIREMVAALIQRCAGLQILCTSRRTLGWDGVEQIFNIPPLDLPDPEALPELAELAEIDAVELLVERIRAHSPQFILTKENARDVALLCRALEGIPLALELAAAQLRTLDIDYILSRLEQRLTLLTRESVPVEERHWASLIEAMSVSYGLLDSDQQIVFRRLAVFRRGWTRDAATAVCQEGAQDRLVLHRLLDQLHAMSLIAIEESNGRKRYRMLDFIRDYAEDRLRQSNEEAELRARHARWYAEFAETAAPELLKKDQARWLDALVAEADNFRAALIHAMQIRDARLALRITGSLWRMMEIRGYYREGVERLDAVLDMPETAQFAELRAGTLSGVGMLAYRQGQMDLAERYFQEALEIETRLQRPAGIANALNDLGNVAQMKGDFETASARYEQCLALERRSGNNRAIAVALFNVGHTERRLGHSEVALTLLNESLARFQADANLREAAFPLNSLALLSLANGDFAAALRYAGESLRIRQDLGDRKGVADTMRTLANIYIHQGDFPLAHETLWNSLSAAHAVNDRRGLAESFELFAEVAARLEDWPSSVNLYSAADKIRSEIRIPLAPLERDARNQALDSARAVLSKQEFLLASNAETPLDIPAALGASEKLRAKAASR